jgi:glycopeptide antibiotics resistance protein
MCKTKYLIYFFYIIAVVFVVAVAGNDYRIVHFFAFNQPVNLIPLKSKINYLQCTTCSHTPKDYFYFVREIIGNLLLLFPVPLFLIVGEGVNSRKKTVLISLGISLSIEVLQLLSSTGSADLDDILLNTLGASLGAQTTFWLKKSRFWPSFRSYLHLPA